MDAVLQRLVVRGPAGDVQAFSKAAVSRSKPLYLTIDPVHRTQKLSFEKLLKLTADGARLDVDFEEPWDLVVDPLVSHKDGSVELTYKFQLDVRKSEFDALIEAVSKKFPRLCFVLGSVCPAADEQISLLACKGRLRHWKLPQKRVEALQADIPEETEDNSDDVFWAEIETDWAMMDAVVDHWNPTMDQLMRKAARGIRSRRIDGTSRRKRRRERSSR